MGVDLSGEGGDMSLSHSAWAGLLDLAIQFGWVPEGTKDPEPPEEYAPPNRPWDGNYVSNAWQVVTESDALSLGRALLRAVNDTLEKCPGKSYDDVRLIVELGIFAVSGTFQIW